MNASDFWRWFQSERDLPEGQSCESTADAIYERLDPRLGVEIAEDGQLREVIFTAYGETELFPLVRELVDKAPAIAQWKFVALKPAMGFEFKFSYDDGEMDASELVFDPLVDKATPEHFGILLFVPDGVVAWPGLIDALCNIVQTGIGELAASTIAHLEAAPRSTATGEELSIRDLGAYLTWREARQKGDAASQP